MDFPFLFSIYTASSEKKVCLGGIILQSLIQLFLLSKRYRKGQVRILDTAQSIKNWEWKESQLVAKWYV